MQETGVFFGLGVCLEVELVLLLTSTMQYGAVGNPLHPFFIQFCCKSQELHRFIDTDLLPASSPEIILKLSNPGSTKKVNITNYRSQWHRHAFPPRLPTTAP